MGIIGGSGLDDPEILDDRREIYRETPYGMIYHHAVSSLISLSF